MSHLILKPAGVKLVAQELIDLVGSNDFSEIGLVYADSGTLVRIAGDLENVEHACFNIYDNTAAMLYLDNPISNYDAEHFSPLIVGDRIAFASCGEMLALKESQKNLSNNSVFNKQTMKVVYESNPDLLFTPAFSWMFTKIARSFIGAAVLNCDGEFYLYNRHLFSEHNDLFYMDSVEAENKSDKEKSWRKPDLSEILALSVV